MSKNGNERVRSKAGMRGVGPLALFAIALAAGAHLGAQQQPVNYRSMLSDRVRSQKTSSPAHLHSYVKDGKISLSLRDAILLMLENNSNIAIQELQIEAAKFNLLSSFQAFDPSLASQWNVNRYSNPTYSQLQGVTSNGVSNSLTQSGQVTYTQTFVPGTNVSASISSQKNSTNSSYNYFNPYYSSTFSLQFTQPLLRNGGRFANTAPILIARRSLSQSHASFEAAVNDAVLQAVNCYWNAVQARGTLDVQKKSYQLADLSYQHDKRALELGALPPLDIYRSQAEMAARKVQVIQAENALTQAEEALRLIVGADQDPQYRVMEFELTEKPQPESTLEDVSLDRALSDALSRRPEIDSMKNALERDDLSIRYARNQLKPNLTVTGFYQSSGLGGAQGMGDSFNQAFNFGFPGYGGALTLQWPIKNRAAQASLGNALVSRTRDLYSDRLTKEQIAQDVTDAVRQLDETKMAMEAGAISFDLAQKTLASDQRKYELGSETNFVVLDSQNKLAQAELTLLETQISYQIAVATIHHATGSLLDPFHLQVSQIAK